MPTETTNYGGRLLYGHTASVWSAAWSSTIIIMVGWPMR